MHYQIKSFLSILDLYVHALIYISTSLLNVLFQYGIIYRIYSEQMFSLWISAVGLVWLNPQRISSDGLKIIVWSKAIQSIDAEKGSWITIVQNCIITATWLYGGVFCISLNSTCIELKNWISWSLCSFGQTNARLCPEYIDWLNFCITSLRLIQSILKLRLSIE